MILEQFDPNPKAVLDPTTFIQPIEGFPKIIVSCFARTQFTRLKESLNDVQEIAESKAANMVTPIYRAPYRGLTIGLVMAEVGASTCVGLFEEIFAMGAETIILYGTCGVLNSDIADCTIVLPTSAVRDEGTSYHYAPPSDEIACNVKYGKLFEELLKELKIPYHKGKTWTTDGVYRETPDKVKLRTEQGCITVEMEISAMAALAQFRGKNVLQFLYAADNLDSPEWDERSLSGDAKVEEKDGIGRLALETAYRIAKTEGMVES